MKWNHSSLVSPTEKPLPPSERHLLARWGGTAGVVNQAATVQGTATSQHQVLTATSHIFRLHALWLDVISQQTFNWYCVLHLIEMI